MHESSSAPQYNQSTIKVLSIIECLAHQSGPVRLQTIAAELDMNMSTVSRFLSSLIYSGYVCQEEETQKYMLTMKICSLSHQVLSQHNIINYAQPFLEQVSKAFVEVSCLTIEQDQTVVYIATHDSPDQMLKTFTYIGKRAPMHCTAAGKLYLTNYTDDQIVDYLKRYGNIRPTVHTITSYAKLKKEINNIREKGYSLDNEECEIGMRCVAVPICDFTSKVVACLSVTGPTARMTEEKINTNLKKLLDCARQVSILMGGSES